jgi:electron transfer flavoprotein beta subunit
VKEGLNLPRYPSVPGRLRAKKKPLDTRTPQRAAQGVEKVRLVVPQDEGAQTEILGRGPDAAPAVVAVLERAGVLS